MNYADIDFTLIAPASLMIGMDTFAMPVEAFCSLHGIIYKALK